MAILKSSKIYKDLDLSFATHPQNKDVLKKVDINAIRQSIKNLLFTRFGERLFQPEIGSGIYNLLFEPLDNISANALKKAVTTVIQNYEPRAKIEQVDVLPDYDTNSYEVTIFFRVVGIAQTTSLSLTLERLR